MFCPHCHREYPTEYRFCPQDGQPTRDEPAIERMPASTTRISDALLAGRYRVRGFIGKGAMARVYLAEDEHTQRPVAVKVLDGPGASAPQARERFLLEARTASLIEHPNVVRVLDTGQREDGAPFLVMEFLFGESVGTLLHRQGPIAANIALPALQQATAALWSAHQQGIIHRDVKPDNLYLVGEPGDPYDLKVLDFGLSRLPTSDLTAAGTVLGTPGYMAPEQVLGETVDQRTDVYGLGMVMYRMFTGRHPFSAADEVAILAHHVLTPAPPPSHYVPELDPRIEQIILTAIQKRPDNRYADMAIFYDDLGRVLTDRQSLWASLKQADSYQPTSSVAKLVASSLNRAIGLDDSCSWN